MTEPGDASPSNEHGGTFKNRTFVMDPSQPVMEEQGDLAQLHPAEDDGGLSEMLGFNPTDDEMSAFIEPDSIVVGDLLGVGGLSQAVRRGTWTRLGPMLNPDGTLSPSRIEETVPVAVKLFSKPDSESLCSSLRREFRASLAVGRSNMGQRLCEVVGWSLLPQPAADGQIELSPAIVMEVLPDSLGALLKRLPRPNGGLPELWTLVLGLGIAQALQELHDVHSHVHRDVKPQNVLLNHYSKYPFVVLGDYGAMLSLAEAQAIFEARRNSPGAGTPVYMPVEQVDRRCEVAAVGPKTDVWALGCCLLEMASGQVPWAALRNVGSYQRWCHAIAYMLHKGHTPQVPDGCCSRELAWVIKHCLSHHPSGRPSARDVATDLRSLIAARFARARAADGATFGPESYRLHQELLSLHQHLAASAAASEHTPGDGPIAWRIADSKGQTLSDPTGTSAEAVARRSGLPPSHTVAELVEPPELGAWDPDHEFFGLPGYPLPAVDMGAAPVVPRVAQPFYKALLDVARGGSPEPCVKGILDPPAPTHGRHQSLESSISSAPAGPLSPQGMPRRARLGEVPPWERGGAPARRGNVASGDRDGSEAAQDDGASDGAGLPQTSTTARRQRDRERSAFGGALRDASAGTGGGAGSGSRGSGSRGSVLPAGGTWASGSEQWGEGSAREGPSDSVVDDWAPDRSPIPVFTSRGLSRGAGWVPAAHWRPLEPSLSEEVSPGTPFPAEAHRTGSGGALGRAEGQSGAGVGLGIESVSAPAMHRGISRNRLLPAPLFVTEAVYEEPQMSQSETSHVGIREERGFRSRPEQVPLSDSEEEEEDEGDEGEGGEPGRLISLRKRQSLSGPAGDAEGVDGSIIGSSDHGSLRGHVSRRISLLALEYVQSRMLSMSLSKSSRAEDVVEAREGVPEESEGPWDLVDLDCLSAAERKLIQRHRLPGDSIAVDRGGRVRECGAYILLDGHVSRGCGAGDSVSVALVGVSPDDRGAFTGALAKALAACARLAEDSKRDLGLVTCHGVLPLSVAGVSGAALVVEHIPFTLADIIDGAVSTPGSVSLPTFQSLVAQLATRLSHRESHMSMSKSTAPVASLAACQPSDVAVIPSNAATSPCSTSTTGRRSSKEACPSAECGTEVGTPGTRKRSESGGTLSDTRPGWEQDTSLRAFLLRGHVSAVRVLPLGSYLPALDEILTFGLPDHGMVPPEVLESLVCAAKAERAQEAQAERASAGGGLSDESAAPSIESDVWAAGRMLLEVASGLPGGGEGWHREVLSCCLLPAAADRPSVATLRGLFADACA